jgi:hypothetical protein
MMCILTFGDSSLLSLRWLHGGAASLWSSIDGVTRDHRGQSDPEMRGKA